MTIIEKKSTKPAIKVGLTGGIGCGKSAVTCLFEEKGIPIIDADQIAKEIVNIGEPALNEIVRAFGKDILQTDGQLNRRALRDIVFNNKDKLNQLENILHPRVKYEIREKMSLNADKAPYLIVDVPLLLEKKYQSLFDKILVVDCLPEQQIVRVKSRDGSNTEQVQAIIDAQATRQTRLAAADRVLDNTGSFAKLSKQVEEYHNVLMELLIKPSIKAPKIK